MKRHIIASLLLMASPELYGCTRFSAEVSAPEPGTLATEAAKLIAEKKYSDAIMAFRNIQQEYPNSEWSARAKIGTAMVLVSYDNPKRDYVQALKEFDEFLAQYPAHEKAGDVRNWRLAIKTLLDAKKENERLNKSIEQLKQLDMRQEEKRRR